VTAATVELCQDGCTNQPGCFGVEYNSATGECQLHQTIDSFHTTEVGGSCTDVTCLQCMTPPYLDIVAVSSPLTAASLFINVTLRFSFSTLDLTLRLSVKRDSDDETVARQPPLPILGFTAETTFTLPIDGPDWPLSPDDTYLVLAYVHPSDALPPVWPQRIVSDTDNSLVVTVPTLPPTESPTFSAPLISPPLGDCFELLPSGCCRTAGNGNGASVASEAVNVLACHDACDSEPGCLGVEFDSTTGVCLLYSTTDSFHHTEAGGVCTTSQCWQCPTLPYIEAVNHPAPLTTADVDVAVTLRYFFPSLDFLIRLSLKRDSDSFTVAKLPPFLVPANTGETTYILPVDAASFPLDVAETYRVLVYAHPAAAVPPVWPQRVADHLVTGINVVPGTASQPATDTCAEVLPSGCCRTSTGGGGSFQTVSNITLEQCRSSCSELASCHGVQHNSGTQSCELHDSPDDFFLTTSEGVCATERCFDCPPLVVEIFFPGAAIDETNEAEWVAAVEAALYTTRRRHRARRAVDPSAVLEVTAGDASVAITFRDTTTRATVLATVQSPAGFCPTVSGVTHCGTLVDPAATAAPTAAPVVPAPGAATNNGDETTEAATQSSLNIGLAAAVVLILIMLAATTAYVLGRRAGAGNTGTAGHSGDRSLAVMSNSSFGLSINTDVDSSRGMTPSFSVSSTGGASIMSPFDWDDGELGELNVSESFA